MSPGLVGVQKSHSTQPRILIRSGQAQWHLLYTKSRQEKLLSDDLTAMGVDHFLPLLTQVRNYAGRRTVINTPLFAGYLFVLGGMDDAYRADRTKRVARVIRVADQDRLDWELENLQLALYRGGALMPYPFIEKGTRVEVRSGPFRGLQGVVEDRRSNRLLLQVRMLARAISLEIDAGMLDVLPEDSRL